MSMISAITATLGLVPTKLGRAVKIRKRVLSAFSSSTLGRNATVTQHDVTAVRDDEIPAGGGGEPFTKAVVTYRVMASELDFTPDANDELTDGDDRYTIAGCEPAADGNVLIIRCVRSK